MSPPQSRRSKREAEAEAERRAREKADTKREAEHALELRRLSADRDRIQRKNVALEDRIAMIEDRLAKMTESRDLARFEAGRFGSANNPILWYLTFAQKLATMPELAASVYVGHGVQTVPTTNRLRSEFGGVSVCDVIEIPSFEARITQLPWDRTLLDMVDYGLGGQLGDADLLTTVGWELAEHLKERHSDVRVIPNYRNFSAPTPDGRIHTEFGLPEDAKIALCISTIASGFEAVVRGIAELPDHVHLVTVGQFAPEEYQREIEAVCRSAGVTDRVHFRGPVPYEELGAYCASADVGLIVRDPAVPNNRVSLPNRVFDYLAGALPMVSPRIADISRILQDANCGISLDEQTPEAWRDGILGALDNSDTFRRNAAEANRAMTWESLEDDLVQQLGSPSSVLFVGMSDLRKNNRTMRMATTLLQRGVKVSTVHLEGRHGHPRHVTLNADTATA